MSLLKFRRNPFPRVSNGISSWLATDDFFADDFFVKNCHLPAMNIKEHENDFEIELAVPGFSKKDIEVTIEDDVLKVYAQKNEKEEEDDNGYTRKEFSYNEFQRQLQLPTSIDPKEEVTASYTNGILRLTLQKKEGVKELPKKVIEIT